MRQPILYYYYRNRHQPEICRYISLKNNSPFILGHSLEIRYSFTHNPQLLIHPRSNQLRYLPRTNKMAILLTGGTDAQTSVHIASRCTKADIPFLFASRRGASENTNSTLAVRFDWTDPSTYPEPFSHVFPDGETITAVYMIMPRVEQPEKHMNAFVDYAITRGVKRFVLMAGTTAALGGYGAGQVWQHLVERGVEYAICRPTWFQGNISSTQDLWYSRLLMQVVCRELHQRNAPRYHP